MAKPQGKPQGCEIKKYCNECPDNSKGCSSPKGYCILRKYCVECSDCGV